MSALPARFESGRTERAGNWQVGHPSLLLKWSRGQNRGLAPVGGQSLREVTRGSFVPKLVFRRRRSGSHTRYAALLSDGDVSAAPLASASGLAAGSDDAPVRFARSG